jgi:thiol-disulfide isomerase/thioredoxin
VIGIIAAVAALGAFVVVLVALDDEGSSPPETEVDLTFSGQDDESAVDDLIGGDVDGEAAPDATFALLDGGSMKLPDLRGTPVVVNFFASWCTPCVTEMPGFEEVHRELGDQVAFVGLDVRDSVDAARDLVEETGVTYTIGRDPSGALFQAFDGLNMPSTFLISADGVIVDAKAGAMDADELRERIDEHLLSPS